ncbi:hypothetical protein Bca4012_002401 [Brassica carinata]
MGLKPNPTKPDRFHAEPHVERNRHVLRSSPTRRHMSLPPHLDRHRFKQKPAAQSIKSLHLWSHKPAPMDLKKPPSPGTKKDRSETQTREKHNANQTCMKKSEENRTDGGCGSLHRRPEFRQKT